MIDPRSGTVTARQIVDHRLARFAGPVCIANVDAATAHDGYPLLKRSYNAQACAKLHGVESAGVRLRLIRIGP
jgi:hypothetical protein